jgi:hypothetical protein
MTMTQAISGGFSKSLSSGRMIVLLYIINLLFALTVALAFRSTVLSSVESTMAVEALVAGFDFTVYSDFWHHFGDRIDPLITLVLWLTGFYLFFGTFLGGGILTTLQNAAESFSISQFFKHCGMYLFRFVRLFLLCSVVTLLVSILFGVSIAALFTAVTADPTSERDYVVWGSVLFALFLVPVLILVLISDYARIDTVLNDRKGMSKAFWHSLKFVLRNAHRTVGLHAFVLVIVGIIIVAYWFVDFIVGMTSGVTVFFMFMTQQVSVVGKIWTRVLNAGSQVELYQGLTHVDVTPAQDAMTPVQFNHLLARNAYRSRGKRLSGRQSGCLGLPRRNVSDLHMSA